MAMSSACDRFCRLLGCASGASELDESSDEAEEALLEDEDDLEACLEAAAAARAACVIGT